MNDSESSEALHAGVRLNERVLRGVEIRTGRAAIRVAVRNTFIMVAAGKDEITPPALALTGSSRAWLYPQQWTETITRSTL